MFIQQRPVKRQSQQFGLLVCNDRHRLLVRIDRFNVPTYDFLHGLQALDLPHIAGLQWFHDQYLHSRSPFPLRLFVLPLYK